MIGRNKMRLVPGVSTGPTLAEWTRRLRRVIKPHIGFRRKRCKISLAGPRLETQRCLRA